MADLAARAKSLFLAASDLSDEAERAAYLERECGGDAALRQRVEALLTGQRRIAVTTSRHRGFDRRLAPCATGAGSAGLPDAQARSRSGTTLEHRRS